MDANPKTGDLQPMPTQLDGHRRFERRILSHSGDDQTQSVLRFAF